MSRTHDYVRAIVTAAETRGWILVRFDAREGVILQDGAMHPMTIIVRGPDLTPAFIRHLPLAFIPPERQQLDGSPCWCHSATDEEPHAGWVHARDCEERRELAGVLDG